MFGVYATFPYFLSLIPFFLEKKKKKKLRRCWLSLFRFVFLIRSVESFLVDEFNASRWLRWHFTQTFLYTRTHTLYFHLLNNSLMFFRFYFQFLLFVYSVLEIVSTRIYHSHLIHPLLPAHSDTAHSTQHTRVHYILSLYPVRMPLKIQAVKME